MEKNKLIVLIIALFFITVVPLNDVFANGGGGDGPGGGDASADVSAATGIGDQGHGFAGANGSNGFGGTSGSSSSSGGSSGSGGPGDSGGPNIGSPINVCVSNQGDVCSSGPNTCGQTNSGTVSCNGNCSASVPANPSYYGGDCTSEENSCYMTNPGIIDCNNVCNAVIPPVSACPLPIIPTPNPENPDTDPETPNPEDSDTDTETPDPEDPDTDDDDPLDLTTVQGFQTDDNIYFVVKSTTKTLVWGGIGYATRCTVTGPDDFSSSYTYTEEESTNATISGSVESPQIEHKSEFTLTCYNGDGPDAPSASVSFFINLIPSYKEI